MKRRYTKQEINFDDIFVKSVNNEPSLGYLANRTLLRPRDIILFVNECIYNAQGCESITATHIKNAEEDYSIKRLESLATEWLTIFPNLNLTCRFLNDLNSSFHVYELTNDILTEKFEELFSSLNEEKINSDTISSTVNSLYSSGNFKSVRNFLLSSFYNIGLIGIKLLPTSTIKWAHLSRLSAPLGEIRNSSIIYIHPMYHRALNTRT